MSFCAIRRIVLGLLGVFFAAGVTTAVAGNGIGAVFNLGQTNTVDASNTLSGVVPGTLLNVTNTSKNTYARGLAVKNSGSGEPAHRRLRHDHRQPASG